MDKKNIRRTFTLEYKQDAVKSVTLNLSERSELERLRKDTQYLLIRLSCLVNYQFRSLQNDFHPK
ncbi:hypothetical protein GCM10007855_02840 [Aliivibrio sifiae]|uniref:Transposase n=1 Tax=Aliivibrio sifiae TaxID=566293 RepID=A0ABQ6AF17_9GAMM|nr:hypothetical protein GCM10007855_02840 [Aliivibrio sifiae]